LPDKLKGTYVLEFSILQELNLRVRSGKEFFLLPGLYAYVGSAFGSGGIPSRLYRHLKREKKRHWHLDFITTFPYFSPLLVVVIPNLRVECEVAGFISKFGSPVPSFGSSDCPCTSHLFSVRSLEEVNSGLLKKFSGAKIFKTSQLERVWSLKSS